MGLDIVELVMRTETDFGIEIDDYDAGQVEKVGDLYQLVCRLLGVLPHPHPNELQDSVPIANYTSRGVLTPEDIWLKLVKIIEDQLQVDRGEIRYNATFLKDLGAD